MNVHNWYMEHVAKGMFIIIVVHTSENGRIQSRRDYLVFFFLLVVSLCSFLSLLLSLLMLFLVLARSV